MQRYESWDDVLGYCRYSANPVGRLVLYLCGYRDAERQRLSDATCTALQLANFWQDVSRDLDKGRIYIPLDAMRAPRPLAGRYRGAPLRPALRRADEGPDRAHARAFRRGRAAGLDQVDAQLARRPRSVQPRRPGRPRRHRGAGLQHARTPPRHRRGHARALAGARRRRPRSAPQLSPNARPASPRAHAAQRAARRIRQRRRRLSGRAAARPLRPRASAGRSLVPASYAECRRVARAAASNFYLRLLHAAPAQARRPLRPLRLHAPGRRRFRHAGIVRRDSLNESDRSAADAKTAALARWRAMLDQAVAGDASGASDPPGLCRHPAPLPHPAALFSRSDLRREMDLTETRYATFERLREYCYRVAGTVGLTCLHVFEFDDPHAPDLAEQLGIAFQLTNILRDVPGDLALGRVYLPAGGSRRASAAPPKNSPAAWSRRPCANCCASRPNAPGTSTPRAPPASAGRSRQPRRALGPDAHLQRACSRASKSAILTCSPRACA